ncbi:MAG: alpha/beta fold hydrolase [Bacteroidia bacterium]|nr:alpha/beta fold hydrolase [Bacteroidia bacterium]
MFRKVELDRYTRERIATPDDDFLDIDWLQAGADKLVIISHGLEGNTQRPYVRGMARAAAAHGFDVLAWNYRGCSETLNHQRRFYHSGATDDLAVVVNHAHQLQRYREICLVGFSLGGNLTLKYLGEPRNVPSTIARAAVFSVPMDLKTSCEQISKPQNWIYARRFLRSLKEKVSKKAMVMPDIDVTNLHQIKTLTAFDDRYTAPLHGYRDAADYYEQCSANRFVMNIHVPALIVNAKNDPFLSPECYPVERLRNHPCVSLEAPDHGGHVGFVSINAKGHYWSEQRAMSFLSA